MSKTSCHYHRVRKLVSAEGCLPSKRLLAEFKHSHEDNLSKDGARQFSIADNLKCQWGRFYKISSLQEINQVVVDPTFNCDLRKTQAYKSALETAENWLKDKNNLQKVKEAVVDVQSQKDDLNQAHETERLIFIEVVMLNEVENNIFDIFVKENETGFRIYFKPNHVTVHSGETVESDLLDRTLRFWSRSSNMY